MSLLERIILKSGKCGGRPCIRRMRIRVKDVLEMLAARVPENEILADFPIWSRRTLTPASNTPPCNATTPF